MCEQTQPRSSGYAGVGMIGDLSDVLCEVGVTDAALWAGKGHTDVDPENEVQRGRVVSPRGAREFC